MNTILLTIQRGVLVARVCERTYLIQEPADVVDVMNFEDTNRVVCSDVLDFPEEYTNDQAVVDLCNEIRTDHREM